MRRFNVRSIAHAKNLAKSMKAELLDLEFSIPLNRSQHLLAAFLGYSSWHDLSESIGTVDGPYDDELSSSEIKDRRDNALRHLSLFGVPISVGIALLDRVGPTSRAWHERDIQNWNIITEGEWNSVLGDRVFSIKFSSGGVSYASYERHQGRDMFTDEALEGQFYFEPLGTSGSLDGAKRVVSRWIRENPSLGRGLDVPGRQTQEFEPEPIEWTEEELATLVETGRVSRITFRDPDEPVVFEVQSVTPIAPGLELHVANDDMFLNASSAWLDRLPPLFRPQCEYADGMDFYWYETGQVFPLCFPEIFSPQEVADAVKWIKEEHPETYRIFLLGQKATEEEILRGGRGFATDHIEYALVEVLSAEPSGSVIVVATILSIQGPQHQGDMPEDENYLFRLKPGSLDEVCGLNRNRPINQDDDEFLGVYSG